MSGKNAEKLQQWEARKSQYTNTWKTGLMASPCADPLCCCAALWCGCCTSWYMRKKAMHGSLEGYTCCNGAFPCSGKCGESACPEACLCLETCCCFGTSVAVTRWMIQDELHIQNTQCDNCIIGTMIFFQQLACICNIIACLTDNDEIELIAEVIDLIAELLWWTVCACMQTQHHVQLNDRDKNGGGGVQQVPRANEIQGQVPPGYPAPQQQMGANYNPQGYNPQGQPAGYPQVQAPGGYPPQQGYPPASYPPQQGYPPASYPPQQGYPPASYPVQQGMAR
ncbi:unnamed protein product [Ostreobium quekettii]|uniref:PLAC8 family protein n=1 Tax=Ostreobium quekettii TaxID=121088 RepID=A0A8S1IQX0_9CHLO|nr:unnamed protein product [Ostreobium quekettii]|eukprot:evm.model.scf_49.16 EVM.evm.TU.scf_49.16   scf_49:153855-156564(+)